jgi:F-type H+-transporting ATPase subunit b
MSRVRDLRKPVPRVAALLGAVLAASPAAASEGDLEIFPQPVPLIVLIALFAVIIWPANALLWRPLLRVFDERSDRIAGTRARAEKVAAEAKDVLSTYEASVVRARQAADGERGRILDAARHEHAELTAVVRREAESQVTAAREAVEAAVQRARRDLQATAAELGREAAARVLGRPLS